MNGRVFLSVYRGLRRTQEPLRTLCPFFVFILIPNMVQLIHGDCIEVMTDLAAKGTKVSLILTDLPYGTTACK